MRDYIEPAAVIAARVPMHLLDAAYGMRIQRLLDVMDDKDRPPTAHEMLSAYCAVKGYITNGTGRWDEFRACKDMLRDFTDGRILYVAPPPTMQPIHGEEGVEEKGKREQQLAQWVQETEKVMLRTEKIADRVAVQKLKECCSSNSENDNNSNSVGGGEMVFGGSKYPETEFVMDESDSDSINEDNDAHNRNNESLAEGSVASKREHKRLKHWGKKNKKLRDKTPYGEENGVISYVAYSTNRSGVVGGVSGSMEKEKLRRQDPRHAYGHAFVRSSLPHQQPKGLASASVLAT